MFSSEVWNNDYIMIRNFSDFTHVRKLSENRPKTSRDVNPFLRIVSLQTNPLTSASLFRTGLERKLYHAEENSKNNAIQTKSPEKVEPHVLHYKTKSCTESISSIPLLSERILARNKMIHFRTGASKESYSMKTLQLKFFNGPDKGARIHQGLATNKRKLMISKVVKRKNHLKRIIKNSEEIDWLSN